MVEPHDIAKIFIEIPKSDVILRSSDNVDFRFLKSLLSLSSSFFETMFSLPQSPEAQNGSEMKDGLPLIPIAETSSTLEKVLLFCLPVSVAGVPELETLEDVQAVLEAAFKYDMKGLEKHVGKVLVDPRFGEKEPMRVLAIACRYRLDKEVHIAAKYTLGIPILQGSYVPELEHMSAGQLQRVQEYYRKCSEATQKVTTEFEWMKNSDFTWFHCPRGAGQCATDEVRLFGADYKVISSWWSAYLKRSAEALNLRPCGHEVKRRIDLIDEALSTARLCSHCGSANTFADMRRFVELLANEVDRVVSEVRVYLPF